MVRNKKITAKSSTRAAQIAKERSKGKHKITVQNSSKEKGKPLHSVITIKADPPPGYTFIPAGNPELTQALKEFSRQGDHKIYAVTTTPHATRHELSREVHRVGFHFPTQVVAQVCSYYGIRLTSGGKLIDESKDDKTSFMQVYKKGERTQIKEPPKDQITINTEAKQTLKDLFPKIPDNDLFQIIKTAFQLGDGKVGTAEEIPLVRRAQLAVVAHIRHIYTGYDKYLRKMPYNDARHAVEQETLAKLVEWRGDDDEADEAARHAAADALREVIVISDEEDSDSGSDGVEQIPQDRIRVEELATTAYAPISSRQISPNPGVLQGGSQQYMLPQVVHRYRPTQDEIAQRDQSRYDVWNQAKRSYQSSVVQRPAPILERIYEPEVVPRSRVLVPLDAPAYPPEQVHRTQASIPIVSRIEHEPRIVRAASPPPFFRGPNGAIYERVINRPQEPIVSHPQMQRQRTPPPRPNHGYMVRTLPSSPQDFNQGDYRYYRAPEGNETVLPSIEPSDGLPASPRSRPNPFKRHSEPRDLDSGRYGDRVFRDAIPVEYPSSADQSFKRRRVDDWERTQYQAEYAPVRRQSPPRHVEVRHSNYVQQPLSPRPQMLDHRHDLDRHYPQVSYEASGSIRGGTSVQRPTIDAHDFRDNTTLQLHHSVQIEPRITRAQPVTSMRNGGVRNQDDHYTTRTYEPLPETYAYANRTAVDHNMNAGEDVIRSNPYTYRPQREYRAEAMYHDTVGSQPRQHVAYYD